MAQPPIAPPPGFDAPPPGLDRPQDLDLKSIQQLGNKILAKSNETPANNDNKHSNAAVVSEDSSEKKEKLENASVKNQNERNTNNKRRGRGNNQPRSQGDRHNNNAHANTEEHKPHSRNPGRGRGQQRGEQSSRGRGSNNAQSANVPATGKKLKNISDFNSRSTTDDKAAEKQEERATNNKTTTTTTTEDAADDSDAVYCLTCCEPITFFALGPCNHRDLCDKCSLRMRECYKDNTCPLCKNAIEQVLYTRDTSKKYEEYDVKQMWYDELLKAYFEDEAHYTQTLALWDFVCPVCRDHKSKFNGLFALQKHIKTAHQLYYCEVCLKYRKVFLHEQKLYSKQDLPKHKREGDAELKLKPHSWCEYCKQYLFGEDELFYHCHDKHETCFLCEGKGIRWQYFRNYEHLERHYDARHHLCHDEECLARKFVVFDSPIELQAHRISVHGKQMSKQELLQAKTLQVNWNASSQNNTTQNNSAEEGYVMHLKFDVGAGAQSPNAIKSALASNEAPNTNTNNNNNNNNSGGNAAANLSRDEIAKRNKAVISAMKAYLGNEAKFTQFRNVSAQFRQRQLSTDKYWQEFISIFGKDITALDLFEALTELLPDTDADLRATLLTLVAAARLDQGPSRVDSRQFPSLAGNARDGQQVSLSANYSSLIRPSAPPSREEFPALAPSRGASASTRGSALHQHQYFQQHPSLLPNFYAPRTGHAPSNQANNNPASNNSAPDNNQGQQQQQQGQSNKKKKKQVQVLSWG